MILNERAYAFVATKPLENDPVYQDIIEDFGTVRPALSTGEIILTWINTDHIIPATIPADAWVTSGASAIAYIESTMPPVEEEAPIEQGFFAKIASSLGF